MIKLEELLRYRRPAGSQTELTFIKRYLDVIPGMITDAFGNRLLITPGSKTIISTHTDTVHRVAGFQRIVRKGNILSLNPRDKTSNCLGADDTAGVYAALRMIDAKVPATFIFHRQEEIGGKGSAWLAENYPGWLKGFDHCVALDRRGTLDVITHQAWGRCCSDGFAESLAEALTMNHEPCENGIFTDSANYVGLIQECSNLSIGYQHEHTPGETLDVDYLERLIERLIAINWESLPTLEWEDDPLPSWLNHSASSSLNHSSGLRETVISGDCDYCLNDSGQLWRTEENLLACDTCRRYWDDSSEAEETAKRAW